MVEAFRRLGRECQNAWNSSAARQLRMPRLQGVGVPQRLQVRRRAVSVDVVAHHDEELRALA
jgi:hypothetical protein